VRYRTNTDSHIYNGSKEKQSPKPFQKYLDGYFSLDICQQREYEQTKVDHNY